MLDVADKIAIHELVARYNRAIDTGDAADWVNTFTPDGVFDGIVGRFEGHGELAEFADAYLTDPAYEQWRTCQHWVNNILIDGDDAEAALTADHLMVQPTGAGGRILLVARYDDRLRRANGTWLFASRRVRASADSREGSTT